MEQMTVQSSSSMIQRRQKALLAEAGYPNGYDLTMTVNTKYPTSVKIATAIQAQMAEAGIRVEIEQVDSAAWTDMKKAGKSNLWYW